MAVMSRDVFRLYPIEGVELKSYIARQSVCSAVAKPMEVPVRMEDIENLTPFNQRMVYFDLSKTSFDVLGKDGSKWLMLDLIDERFALLYTRGGTCVTESSEYVKCGGLPDTIRLPRKFDGRDYFVAGCCLREDIRLFCQKLLQIYEPDHIILHKAYATERYRSKEGEIRPYPDRSLAMGQNLNKLICYMYGIFEEYLPEAIIIDCCAEYIGDEEHLWGLANVHYENGYYREVMRQVREAMLGI